MEHKWWQRQAMQHVQKRKSCSTARAVERAAQRKCKKDEHQTEVLLAQASDWSTLVFDPKSRVESVTRKTTLVQECLKEAHTLAKRKGETQGGGIHWWSARMITTSCRMMSLQSE
jgi:hypothetical protein